MPDTTPLQTRAAIIGTMGVPGKYGGFETLAENLLRYADTHDGLPTLTVYCSAKAYPERPARYLGADLEYVPLNANGVQSIFYDIYSMVSAIRKKQDCLLILGVSGCLALPVIRRLTRARIVTNIDGLEWRRDKWNGMARWLLKLSEKLAVRHSDVVVSDNQAIADHVRDAYDAASEMIAYGGDHAVATPPTDIADLDLPDSYALGLCRIEPENNVGMILEAFADAPGHPLVFVGNWNAGTYGQNLRARFGDTPGLHLLDPVYDAGRLRAIRDAAKLYVHGHSAGGTNPSLVEMMHFGIPVAAFDCSYNRHTTELEARYFASATALRKILDAPDRAKRDVAEGPLMLEIATRRYTWASVGADYFALMTPAQAAGPL